MKLTLILSGFFLLTIFACDRKVECYSAELAEANSEVLCLQDCPGVCGCDGVFYCNSCIAATHGITVDYEGPCD